MKAPMLMLMLVLPASLFSILLLNLLYPYSRRTA